MDDNIKIEKHCIQIQEARSERKKYANTFTYNNNVRLQYFQPGSYSTDRGSARCTKSIQHISYLIVTTEESFKSISANRIIFQVMFMDHKTWAF